MQNDAGLLLVTHVRIRQGPAGPLIDDQTAAGIAQWRRHFDRVTYCGIADSGIDGTNSANWVNAQDITRSELIAFPRAYRIVEMAKAYKQVRIALREAVGQHRHLCFTIGGIVGDWPAVASIEAIRQKRDYAAWIDRVEPGVIKNKMIGAPLARQLAATAAIPLMERYTRYILRRSTVALLQGRDTFDHYERWASDPHCTYDTHTTVSDQISPEALAIKQDRILSGAPLRIVYAGRADAMKGPIDWLSVLKEMQRRGIPFQATWIGDGPLLVPMQEYARSAGLGRAVDFPGFEEHRGTLLNRLRSADVLMFCHKTPESARCLIESLVSGTPIVGYSTAYPHGLVNDHGGGAFVPQDNVAALAETIGELHQNRAALVRLIGDAAKSGETYNEDAVYAHRAALMLRA